VSAVFWGLDYPLNRRAFLGGCLAAGVAYGLSGCSAADASLCRRKSGWAGVGRREKLRQAWLELMGPFPATTVSLDPQMEFDADSEGLDRHRVSFQAEQSDRITAYLLVPEAAKKTPRPAVICIHGTTWGTGKARTVGLAGMRPDDPPDEPRTSRAYGLELARWGYVTLSIDLLCDGARVSQGLSPYDTRDFYRRHPEWSMVGKNVWDVMRSVDFLQTLDSVDPKRVACLGHSLGGHTSLFAAAFEPRLAAAVCNGGFLSWARNSDHWARPVDSGEKVKGPAVSYVYLPRFRPYIDHPRRPIPVDFDSLMALAAPRPLLIMASEAELEKHRITEKVASAGKVYRELGAGDRLSLFSYPGEHNYPPLAKRHSFNWLDRWLDHTPSVSTIWPGVAI